MQVVVSAHFLQLLLHGVEPSECVTNYDESLPKHLISFAAVSLLCKQCRTQGGWSAMVESATPASSSDSPWQVSIDDLTVVMENPFKELQHCNCDKVASPTVQRYVDRADTL